MKGKERRHSRHAQDDVSSLSQPVMSGCDVYYFGEFAIDLW